MKKTVLFSLFALLLVSSAFSQIKLVGARVNQATSNIELVKWHAFDSTSVSSQLSLLQSYAMASSLFDSYSSNYYLSGYTTEGDEALLTFNTATLTQSLSPFTGLSNITEIDMSTGNIFTLFSQAIGEIEVRQFSISTGISTLLGIITEPGIEGIVVDATGFNSNDGIMYYAGPDGQSVSSLFSIPVRDSVFSYSKLPLDIPEGTYITCLNYDNVKNTLYGFTWTYDPGSGTYSKNIVSINTVTGEVVTEGEILGLEGYILGSACFDQLSGKFLMAGYNQDNELRMYAFNTNNQTLESGFMPSVVSEIVCDNYDFAKSAYPTVGIKETSMNEVHLFPNPAADYVSISGKVPDNVIITIFDMAGKIILNKMAPISSSYHLDIGSVPSGIYRVNLRNESINRSVKLIVDR